MAVKVGVDSLVIKVRTPQSGKKYGLECLSMSLSGITLLGRRGCPAQQHPWLLLATTTPVPVTNSDSRHCHVVPGRHIKSG